MHCAVTCICFGKTPRGKNDGFHRESLWANRGVGDHMYGRTVLGTATQLPFFSLCFKRERTTSKKGHGRDWMING